MATRRRDTLSEHIIVTVPASSPLLHCVTSHGYGMLRRSNWNAVARSQKAERIGGVESAERGIRESDFQSEITNASQHNADFYAHSDSRDGFNRDSEYRS